MSHNYNTASPKFYSELDGKKVAANIRLAIIVHIYILLLPAGTLTGENEEKGKTFHFRRALAPILTIIGFPACKQPT